MLLVACSLAACTSHYTQLKTQRECPDLCSLTDACAGYTHDTHVVPTSGQTPRPVGVAVHEVCGPCGSPSSPHAERTLVLIHGVFADHDAWRFVAGDLRRDFRLLLVDLPGCGHADAPDPDD